jgi:NitT/TauT family transport system permease protein
MNSRRLILLLDVLALLALWFVASRSLNQPYLPDPLRVIETFAAELALTLPGHIAASARRVALSVLFGALTAAPLAILAAQNRLFDRVVSPLLYFIYPAPKIVFLPVIIGFVGLGDPSIVFLMALILFFQVYVIVRDAAAQVPPQTLDSVRSLGAGRFDLLRYVYVPMSIPAVLTALKISVGTAIAVLFIAESIGNNTGLGYYIVVEQWGRLNYPKVYAGILAISLLGLALFGSLTLLEKRLSRWQGAK